MPFEHKIRETKKTTVELQLTGDHYLFAVITFINESGKAINMKITCTSGRDVISPLFREIIFFIRDGNGRRDYRYSRETLKYLYTNGFFSQVIKEAIIEEEGHRSSSLIKYSRKNFAGIVPEITQEIAYKTRSGGRFLYTEHEGINSAIIDIDYNGRSINSVVSLLQLIISFSGNLTDVLPGEINNDK